jgi:hypothetical protein
MKKNKIINDSEKDKKYSGKDFLANFKNITRQVSSQ